MAETTVEPGGRRELLQELSGTLTLFGYPQAVARIQARPRSVSWRAFRASAFFGGGLLLAPLVGLVPPHAPWVVGVLGAAGYLGTRKWRERYTLASFQGLCPRCSGVLRIRPGVPLRASQAVPCGECNHVSLLTVDLPHGEPGGRLLDTGDPSPPSARPSSGDGAEYP